MVFPKISTKNIFGKKKSGKNFEKTKIKKNTGKKKRLNLAWFFTAHLKSAATNSQLRSVICLHSKRFN